MNKWIKRLALSLAVISTPAFANKIAVVDLERALFMSDAAQESFKQVKEQFGDDIVKVEALQKELIASEKKLQKDGAIMSDDEQRKLRNTIKEKQSEFQFFAGKIQQAEQQFKQQYFRANGAGVQKLLKELIDAEKVDMVLNGQAVMYVTPDLDLTKKLLIKINEATAKK